MDLSKFTLPQLIELFHEIVNEIESRFMEIEI